jgi:hypothetical protein
MIGALPRSPNPSNPNRRCNYQILSKWILFGAGENLFFSSVRFMDDQRVCNGAVSRDLNGELWWQFGLKKEK